MGFHCRLGIEGFLFRLLYRFSAWLFRVWLPGLLVWTIDPWSKSPLTNVNNVGIDDGGENGGDVEFDCSDYIVIQIRPGKEEGEW